MLARAENRAAVRAGWRIGTPYTDTLEHTVRCFADARAVRRRGSTPVPAASDATLRGPRGLVRQPGCPPCAWRSPTCFGGSTGGWSTCRDPWPVVSGAALGAGPDSIVGEDHRAARLLTTADPEPGVRRSPARSPRAAPGQAGPVRRRAVEVDVDANGSTGSGCRRCRRALGVVRGCPRRRTLADRCTALCHRPLPRADARTGRAPALRRAWRWTWRSRRGRLPRRSWLARVNAARLSPDHR